MSYCEQCSLRSDQCECAGSIFSPDSLIQAFSTGSISYRGVTSTGYSVPWMNISLPAVSRDDAAMFAAGRCDADGSYAAIRVDQHGHAIISAEQYNALVARLTEIECMLKALLEGQRRS